MELQVVEIDKKIVFPIINELVDTLFTNELDELVDTYCVTNDDKRVFLMFIMTYFYTYLGISPETEKDSHLKQKLKEFLSETIRNPDKRKECLMLYTNFEKIIQKQIKEI